MRATEGGADRAVQEQRRSGFRAARFHRPTMTCDRRCLVMSGGAVEYSSRLPLLVTHKQCTFTCVVWMVADTSKKQEIAPPEKTTRDVCLLLAQLSMWLVKLHHARLSALLQVPSCSRTMLRRICKCQIPSVKFHRIVPVYLRSVKFLHVVT